MQTKDDQPNSICLVSGASGWIGTRLAQTWDKANGALISVEKTNPSQAFTQLQSERTQQTKHVSFVHLAGLAHVPNSTPAQLLTKANVLYAQTMATLCLNNQVNRFIYVSTAKVSELAAQDPYTQSKKQAEVLLKELFKGARCELVILRPPLVYGPRVRANFAKLLKLSDSNWPLPLGCADQPRSMIYLDNFVDAIRWATIQNQLQGEFFVSDDRSLTSAQWIKLLRQALNRPTRLVSLPRAALQILSKAIGQYPAYERLFSQFKIDTSAIKRLGWQPPFTVEQGAHLTAKHWKSAQ
jgi:UDP-glucose 4-epimerase